MLIYNPENRATAQDMLKSPWLNMEPNFEYKMTDREYERMNIIKKSKPDKKRNASRDIVESDNEKNEADDEDNNDSVLLEGNANESDSSNYAEPTDTINIQNFNNSFAIYGQHVKLSALDKANPQFAK